MPTLTIAVDTWAKKSGRQAADLSDDEKALVPGGEYPILAYREVGDHLIVTLDPQKNDLRKLHPSGDNTWFFFKGHVEDASGFGAKNQPKDDPPVQAEQTKGHAFSLPGQRSTFYSGSPMIPGGNFTWAEALHFDGKGNYRTPPNQQTVDRLLASARAMQEVRDRLGRPILINSWYRDPATNQRVGGATQSRHIVGDGVDFRVEGMRPSEVYAALDTWWGNRGGLASSSVFTHLDVRGYRARWSYGF